MITYVINTSENKTFDTEKLFSLVGYIKIVWINSPLDEIDKCAEKIYEKQNVLGADEFRIAIIVDFYNFKHIRKPYAETGFSNLEEEKGVHVSLYYPLIECYVIDHLFDKLSRKNIFPSQRDIFYVQNQGCEPLDSISNEIEQLSNVLTPLKEDKEFLDRLVDDLVENRKIELWKEIFSEIEDNVNSKSKKNKKQYDDEVEIKKLDKKSEKQLLQEKIEKLNPKDREYLNGEIEKELNRLRKSIQLEKRYRSFKLECTDFLTLDFSTVDYPYKGNDPLTMGEFYDSLKERQKKIKRHYYFSSNSGTTIMAAYDTLNLSLYLINIYEQLEISELDEIPRMDVDKLKKVLIKSWNKVCKAKENARQNDTNYFDVEQIVKEQLNLSWESNYDDDESESGLKIQNITEEENNIRSKIDDLDSVGKIYKMILEYASYPSIGMSKQDISRLNHIVNQYLEKRDRDREENVVNEFEVYKRNNNLKETKKCPPMVVYEKIIKDKEQEISEIFKDTLKAEYINSDYSKELKEANTLMSKFKKIKEYGKGNAVGTIIFNVIVCLLILIPYALLQRRIEGLFNVKSIILYLIHIAFFGGVLLFSFTLQKIIIKLRLAKIKRKMKKCLYDCLDKHDKSISQFVQRYQTELPKIEEARYLIREVKKIREFNDQKEKHVKIHRTELEILENHLSSILNNLGIEVEVDPNIAIDGEFSIEEPIKSPQNKVYKVFDIETIEYLFSKEKEDK